MSPLFAKEWLRRKIDSDPDVEVEAGPDLNDWALLGGLDDEILQEENLATVRDRHVIPLRMSLGLLVRQLRLRDGLTVEALAKEADVSEEELNQVEHNPSYTARPRLIYNLSEHFEVRLEDLSQLAGTTRKVDRKLYNTAVKYAAMSDEAAVLTEEQREILDGFVAMLNERYGS